uniref:Ig-like domain-containing protein n=1 Tax=Astyanax mexicanus TaxID=7994 RepID=A0A8B9RCL0_ASTMX
VAHLFHYYENFKSLNTSVLQFKQRLIKLKQPAVPQRHITAFPNGTLRILQLTEKDGGSYLCMYQRPNGEDMELFHVEVLMKPPKIENMGSQQKRVTDGENFLVDCVASGLPDPKVSWSLPDGTNGTLLLQQMGKNDEGDYTCYAKNTLGEDAMKVNVQVVPNSPRIASKDQTSLLAPLVRYQILNDGTLIIKKVTMADQGKYACVARNSAGDDIKNVKLAPPIHSDVIRSVSTQTDF